jgi:hypothetical protein
MVGLCLFAIIAAVAIRELQHQKRRAESMSCRSNLISIGLAARMWASEHEEAFPGGLLVMSKELNSPKVLFCAGNKPFPPGRNGWAAFDDQQSSYIIVSTNMVEGDTNKIFLRCKFHGHLLYGDGSVFDGKKRSGNKSED